MISAVFGILSSRQDPAGTAAYVFERILCPFSQDTHKDAFFHIKNYTPLSKVCQPFAQIPAVKFCIFVALPSFTLVVLCNMTHIFLSLRTFPSHFAFSPIHRRIFTALSHKYAILLLRYLQAFLTVAESVLSIIPIFHDTVTLYI